MAPSRVAPSYLASIREEGHSLEGAAGSVGGNPTKGLRQDTLWGVTWAVQRVELCSRCPEKALSQSVSQVRQPKCAPSLLPLGTTQAWGSPVNKCRDPRGLQEERSREGCNHQEMPSKHFMTLDNEFSETGKVAGPVLILYSHYRLLVGVGRALQPHGKPPHRALGGEWLSSPPES